VPSGDSEAVSAGTTTTLAGVLWTRRAATIRSRVVRVSEGTLIETSPSASVRPVPTFTHGWPCPAGRACATTFRFGTAAPVADVTRPESVTPVPAGIRWAEADPSSEAGKTRTGLGLLAVGDGRGVGVADRCATATAADRDGVGEATTATVVAVGRGLGREDCGAETAVGPVVAGVVVGVGAWDR
jgi:hypothetical protein